MLSFVVRSSLRSPLCQGCNSRATCSDRGTPSSSSSSRKVDSCGGIEGASSFAEGGDTAGWARSRHLDAGRSVVAFHSREGGGESSSSSLLSVLDPRLRLATDPICDCCHAQNGSLIGEEEAGFLSGAGAKRRGERKWGKETRREKKEGPRAKNLSLPLTSPSFRLGSWLRGGGDREQGEKRHGEHLEGSERPLLVAGSPSLLPFFQLPMQLASEAGSFPLLPLFSFGS